MGWVRPERGRHERGSALVLALLAVTVVSGLAAAFLNVSIATTRSLHQGVENTRAFYLAEAGLSEAYFALRLGKSGQIGSATAPARHGQGLLWVDATERPDGAVRLDSTGMCGRGRASLALLVEPVELSLGFFSDEDLVVDAVLLVDGYDSEQGSYSAQVDNSIVLDHSYPHLYVETIHQILFQDGHFYRYHANEGDEYFYDHVVDLQELVGDPAYGPVYDIQWDDFTDGLGDWDDIEYKGVLAYFSTVPQGVEVTSNSPDPAAAVHTEGGGLVGSNGSISFQTASGDPVAVFGDVVPGVSETVSATDDAVISGTTDPRTRTVELPPVEIPETTSLPAVYHDSAIPMVVSPGNVGYASLAVAPDAELVVRGPCNLVLGALTLEPGADLFLDTTDGDVALYVTGPVDLRAGSVVSTSHEAPDEISLQVSEATSADGTPPVKLDATAQFHGTIYSPEAAVRVGSQFEVFGGLVAQSIQLAPGVRLHFDHAGFEGSSMPKFLMWEIVEIPAAARGRRGDPFAVLGVDAATLEKLSDSHDITGITLLIKYVDLWGNVQGYEGPEANFDWSLVRETLSVERTKDGDATDPTEPSDVPEVPRTEVLDYIMAKPRPANEEFTLEMIARSPLHPDELSLLYDAKYQPSGEVLQAILDAQ